MTTDKDNHVSKVLRLLWFVSGMVSLGLGGIGVVLPLLPTTPFILLAAFCFARSSRRCHDWLNGHPIFGPLILNWHSYGAISAKAKLTAAISMVLVFLLSVALKVPTLVLIVQALVLLPASVFVLSRPLPPQDKPEVEP